MLPSNVQSPEISNYGGAFAPNQLKFVTLEAELTHPNEGTANPPCNVCETTQYYKVELAVPGHQREDFFVNITGQGNLSISALHAKTREIQNEEYRKQTFNYDCFNQEVLLPENIDTDFIKSEYRKGILSFWFLKTEKPYQKTATTIIVY
jgi:HSP20 family protein